MEHAPIEHYKEALEEATKLVQEYKAARNLLRERLVTIYTKANAVESGWTGPVYRDVLDSIRQEAKFAIERTE